MDPFIILFEKKVWVFMVVGDRKGTLLVFFQFRRPKAICGTLESCLIL